MNGTKLLSFLFGRLIKGWNKNLSYLKIYIINKWDGIFVINFPNNTCNISFVIILYLYEN